MRHRFRLSIICALLIGACDIHPYRLGGDDGVGDGGVRDGNGNGDGTGGDGGGGDGGGGDGGGGDGGNCVPVPERCDQVDNDCDLLVDEGFSLQSDPANCGACGKTCTLPGAAGTCSAGTCAFACLPGRFDLDGDLGLPGSNGCEYGPCTPTGPETCNFIDDDCDNKIDEQVAGLASDPMNCGACFNQCLFVNVAQTTCTAGVCGYTACRDANSDGFPDFADLVDPPKGCEYTCPVTPRLASEACNAVDDDCDGVVDELPIAGIGGACYPPATAGCTTGAGGTITCRGACQAGTSSCVFGTTTCNGAVTPGVELCDAIDQDCDGNPRNGFDTLNNPNFCGDACLKCTLPNAIPNCVAGVCGIAGCLPGFENPNGLVADGCEYACTRTGAEVCDGKDNDCNTLIDDALAIPAGLDCKKPGTPCANVNPVCSTCGGVTTFRCDYSGVPGAQTTACGSLAFQESRCDGIDNDCDTITDEAFPVTRACDDGKLGVCLGTGRFVCNATQDGVRCNITTPGRTASPEMCNNLDDNCDGLLDNGAPNDLVGIDRNADAIIDYYVFTYEASHPDATAISGGFAKHRACSQRGVVPWSSVPLADATAACAAAGPGFHVCTASEWQRACAGPLGLQYPYGNVYRGGACNGKDYDRDCTPPDTFEALLPTGYDYECPLPNDGIPNTCLSAEGALDLSGNLKEWTSTETVPGSGFFQVRGGAFNNVATALSCSNNFLTFEAAIAFPTIGFRCCVNGP